MRLCFVHIPKAGGTSVTRALRKMFGGDAVLRAGNPTETRIIREHAYPQGQYSVVSAHMPASTLSKHFPDAALYSLVREPVERAASIYKHFSTFEKHPAFGANAGLTFKEHLHWLRDEWQYQTMLQSHFLDRGGVQIFPLSFMDEFFREISERFGVKNTSVERVNAIEKTVDIDDEDRELIYDIYGRDFGIYESAISRFSHLSGAWAQGGK